MRDQEEVYINEPLTSWRIVEILDANPHLKKIMCPPSLFKRTSKKYLDALHELGVEVEPQKRKGRPKKYEAKESVKINLMLKNGNSVEEISEQLGIPLKTVYYLKTKPLKRGRKSKYNMETVKKVGELHRKGLKASEISVKLNIPLRSVYSLINR
jgi:hypothetical protein